MLILALDTTTRTGSCALLRDAEVWCEAASDPGRPPAARLPADLMALLARAGTSLAAVDVYAVATGPGSFTGLRIGIATMQGLAFAAGKPLLGVSALDALAHRVRTIEPEAEDEAIVTWVDAWRGEVYAAVFDPGAESAEPAVALPASLLGQYQDRVAASSGTRLVFAGDGAETYRSQITTALGPGARIVEPPSPILAATIARLARSEVLRGHRPAADAVRPLYVRRSDVELARDRS